MPLDFTVRQTLTDELLYHGINPVPDLLLERHKQAEIDKHPADWGYRHHTVLTASIAATAIGSLVVFLGAVMQLIGTTIPSRAHLIVLFVSGAIILTMTIGMTIVERKQRRGGTIGRFMGPAIWHETEVSYAAENMYKYVIPHDLLTLARHAEAQIAGSTLVIGLLIQDTKLLDPYILLRTPLGEACLGIWDGGKIIHIAEVI